MTRQYVKEARTGCAKLVLANCGEEGEVISRALTRRRRIDGDESIEVLIQTSVTPFGREESPEIHHCAREIHRVEAASISCVSLLRKLQNTQSVTDLGDSSGSEAIRSHVSLVHSEKYDGESLYVRRLRDSEIARALELCMDYVTANGGSES